MSRPTEPLRAARRHVLATLAAQAERVAALDEAGRDDARASAMRVIVRTLDACLRSHLAWEERTLCRALDPFGRGRPGRFGDAMRREHAVVYEVIAALARHSGDPGQLGAFRRDASRLIATARAHFDREERTLFPLLDRILADAATAPSAVGATRHATASEELPS